GEAERPRPGGRSAPERLKVTGSRFDTPIQEMSGFRELPPRARWWIAAVVFVGVAIVLAQLPSVARWSNDEFLAWVGLSAITALLEQFTVKIAHRSEVENYSVTDALWVPALFLYPGAG